MDEIKNGELNSQETESLKNWKPGEQFFGKRPVLIKNGNKTIHNPSIMQLSIILIPAIILTTVGCGMKESPVWIWIVGGAFFLIFLGVATYFCIKQKCYVLLLRIWVGIVTLALILYVGQIH